MRINETMNRVNRVNVSSTQWKPKEMRKTDEPTIPRIPSDSVFASSSLLLFFPSVLHNFYTLSAVCVCSLSCMATVIKNFHVSCTLRSTYSKNATQRNSINHMHCTHSDRETDRQQRCRMLTPFVHSHTHAYTYATNYYSLV